MEEGSQTSGTERCITRAAALRGAGTLLVAPLALWLGASLAGCDRRQPAYAGPTVKPGELSIVSPVNYPPFVITEESGNTGLGVSVCETLGDELGLEVEPILCENADEAYRALRERSADLAGLVTSSETLEGGYLMGEPIMPCDISLVSRTALREQDLESFDQGGVTIFAIDQPFVRSWVEETFDELSVKYVTDPIAMLNAVRAGTVPFCVLGCPEALYYLNAIYTTLVEGLTIDTAYRFAYVVSEDNRELLDATNTVVAELRESGELASMESSWFGRPLDA